MTAQILNAFFKHGHLFFIAQNAYDIVACNDTEFRKQRPDHLKMTIANAVEHNGVDVLKYNMLLYQSVYKLLIGCKDTKKIRITLYYYSLFYSTVVFANKYCFQST